MRTAPIKPSSPHTPNTRRLLIEEGGFLYDSDAYDDDLPYLVDAGGRAHVVLPYSLDTNDMRLQRPEAGFVRAQDFADYVIDAFEWLWTEGATAPKMMTIGLHLRTIGRPGRVRDRAWLGVAVVAPAAHSGSISSGLSRE